MKKITLIGGAPLTGKTTFTLRLAEDNKGVAISSDSIRGWMKSLVRKEDYPGLFYSDDTTAVEFYDKYVTAQSVVDGEIAESLQVQKGILALINNHDIKWNHLLLEGIAITPEFMISIVNNYPDLQIDCMVLIDNNEENIFRRINARGLWGPLDSYPEILRAREVERVVIYNKWFMDQASKYGIKIVEI